MVNQNSVLSSISFSQTSDWNIKQFFSLCSIKSNFDLKKLGTAIKRRKDQMIVEDGKKYKRITIKTNCGGVVVRDEILGEEIKTKNQYYVKAGQLAVSKIDARNGAFGIVPPEADGAIITGNFWVYDVNPTVANVDYLILILSSNVFVQAWQDCSNGSGNRLYLQEEKFLNYKIPMPSILTQKAIMGDYANLVNESAKKEQEIAQLEKSIDEYFLNILGVRVEDIQKNNGSLIRQINYSFLSRWDVWSQTTQYISSKYSFSKFGSVVKGKPIYGANCKGIKKKSDVRYIRITDINEDGSLNDDFVSAEVVDEKYFLEENDFLIARSGNTVGKTFLYKPNMVKCIFAGYLVKYILNPQVVIPEYILYYTKSSLFRSWIRNNQRIFGQPNINGQEYLNADIIVPELEVQKEIVKTVESKRIQIDIKKKESKKLILLAQCQFEEVVFGEA